MNRSWNGRSPAEPRSAVIVMAMICCFLASFLLPGTAADLEGRVIRVMDGDTVKVTLKSGKTETVRFLGVDSPESYITRFGYTEFLGKAASRVTRNLLLGKQVLLKTRRNAESPERDRHGRILAFVHQGTVDICSHLVKIGLARVYRKIPSPRHDELLGYEAEAKQKKLGIWDSDAERVYYRRQFQSKVNRYLVLWFWENDRDFLKEVLCR